MTEVSTRLFYGVFATTSSLLIASEAFSRVQLPFLAIDMILSRKSNSTLQVQFDHSTRSSSSNGDITRFPEEIWEMIKHELIGIELVESEKEHIKEFLCIHCSTECKGFTCTDCQSYSQLSKSFLPVPINWKELSLRECDGCDNYYTDWLDELFGDESDKNRKRINIFLAAHALELIGLGRIENTAIDFELLSPIGIPKNLNQSCQPFDEELPFHAISSFSSTALELPSSPSSIARRFTTLNRIYGVEFGDYKTKTKDSQNAAIVNNEEENRSIEVYEERKKKGSFYTIPSWQLWTKAYNSIW